MKTTVSHIVQQTFNILYLDNFQYVFKMDKHCTTSCLCTLQTKCTCYFTGRYLEQLQLYR